MEALASACSVDQCESAVKRSGFCYGHYMKNWRYSTPTPEHLPRWQDLTGQRFGRLLVEKREGSAWSCQCACGRTAPPDGTQIQHPLPLRATAHPRHRAFLSPRFSTSGRIWVWLVAGSLLRGVRALSVLRW